MKTIISIILSFILGFICCFVIIKFFLGDYNLHNYKSNIFSNIRLTHQLSEALDNNNRDLASQIVKNVLNCEIYELSILENVKLSDDEKMCLKKVKGYLDSSILKNKADKKVSKDLQIIQQKASDYLDGIN